MMPNGNYAIWSSVVDHFVNANLSRQEAIDFMFREDRAAIRMHRDAGEHDTADLKQKALDKQVEKAFNLNYAAQFRLTFEEALETIGVMHSRGEAIDTMFELGVEPTKFLPSIDHAIQKAKEEIVRIEDECKINPK